MNAAATLYTDASTDKTFAYVGNRTDGSLPCSPPSNVQPCHSSSNVHSHPGILIEDVSDPASPHNVGEIGPPHAGLPGITTRELRVWPQKKLLLVMTFRCSSVIHDCAPGNDTTFPFDIKFFDLTDPVQPRFVGSYVPTDRAGVHVKPHEMYLWVDPKDSDRALLWLSTPTASADPNTPNMMIADISNVPGSFHETGPAPVGTAAPVTEVAEGNWNQFFPGSSVPANYDFDLALHSMAPTADGNKTYLAYLRGGFGILDTSAVVNRRDDHHFVSLNDKLMTPVRNFVRWGAGNQCPGTHRGGMLREPLCRPGSRAALRAEHRRGLRDPRGPLLRVALGLGAPHQRRPPQPALSGRRVQDLSEHPGLLGEPRRRLRDRAVHELLLAQPDSSAAARAHRMALGGPPGR